MICILAHGGASSRDDPVGGAGSGVLRPRLVTAGSGARDTARQARRPGCEELAAWIRRQCRRWKRGPRPKTATVERREASVPRHGTRRTPLGADQSRLTNATTELVRLSALRPPHFGSGANE